MTHSINFFLMTMLSAFLGVASLATPVRDRGTVAATHSVVDVTPRADNTCADPTLARTVFQAFSGARLAHYLAFHWTFVYADSRQAAGPAFWTFQGPAFLAWPTEQPFTVPLFALSTAANTDYIFVVGTNAQTPPVVAGFANPVIISWVYNTSECDSVPLMSAVNPSQSDHYYTTDPEEHANLLSVGWADNGVVAYVLPIAGSIV